MNLSKIHHIAIIVSDYEAAKDFYVNKLGFSVIRENYHPDHKIVAIVISALKFVRRSCSTVAYKAHLLPYVATYPLFRA
mgnify:CR=1 FL=1